MKYTKYIYSQGQYWLKNLMVISCLFALLVVLSACNHEEQNDNTSEKTGEVIVGLTDAPGDFTTYTVDVVSLSLTKANGAVVETLPVRTRVDFAQYTEMTEFLTAATIPAGIYVKATLTLDYSNADIRVENDSGESVAASVIQDEDGMVIDEIDLDVRLEGLNALLVAAGIPAHLTLDFDLKATNVVDLNGGSPVVTVNPKLLAQVNVESPKIHRARGPLQSVNTDNKSFRIIIRPFIHVISGADERFGTLTVNTTSETVFDINGNVYQGNAGLTALNQQTALTAVVVIGDLKFGPRRFEATEVRAGSSVAGGTLDVVSGNVISRSGDVVTIKGATLIRSDGSVVFNDEAQVTLADSTLVRRQLSLDSLTKDAISVGQRVSVFGELTDDQPGSLALDATSGFVHMQLTTLRATVSGIAPLTINIQSIDGRRIGLFDFSGSGMNEDADPANYEIDSGNINLNDIGAGDLVKVRGVVEAFGKTGSADFNAQTIINVSAVPGTMLVGWPLTSTTALNISVETENMALDLDGTGLFHHISRAGVAIDLNTQPVSTTIAAKNSIGIYLVLQDGIWQLHTAFTGYLADLQSRLDNGGAVRGLIATGPFDDDTGTMPVTAIVVHIM